MKTNLQEIEYESGTLYHLAEGTDKWRALVHKVMNLRVSQRRGLFGQLRDLASREELCSMEFTYWNVQNLISTLNNNTNF
jgi:hypothetical protein